VIIGMTAPTTFFFNVLFSVGEDDGATEIGETVGVALGEVVGNGVVGVAVG